MAGKVKAIPEGYHTITPYLVVRDANSAIEFYKQAFGAEEVYRMPGPDGKGVMHAELKIGNSMIMLSEECPQAGQCVSPGALKGTTVSLHLYVEDVDKAFKRAIDAGATESMPVNDTFWGDRFGKLNDPYGHAWSMATHTRDLTPEEIRKGAQECFAQMSQH